MLLLLLLLLALWPGQSFLLCAQSNMKLLCLLLWVKKTENGKSFHLSAYCAWHWSQIHFGAISKQWRQKKNGLSAQPKKHSCDNLKRPGIYAFCTRSKSAGTVLIVKSRERKRKVRNDRPGSSPKSRDRSRSKPRDRSRAFPDSDPGIKVNIPEMEIDINRQGNYDRWARVWTSKLKKAPKIILQFV